jgi:hypothetical protein
MRQNSEKTLKLAGQKGQVTWRRIVISKYYRDKSLADDLNGTGYCTCESSLVLRSTEIHPAFYDLFINPPSDLSLLGLQMPTKSNAK